MSKNIKLTSRYTVFVIYQDKSHYSSTYNVLQKKTVICEENIYRLNLVRRFKKQSDLSLYDHKFYLICCQWNTREPDAVCNVSYCFFTIIQSPTISSSYISTSLAAVFRTQPHRSYT